MNPLYQLRGTIEALNCQALDIQKQELLSLIETLAPSNGNDVHERTTGGDGERPAERTGPPAGREGRLDCHPWWRAG